MIKELNKTGNNNFIYFWNFITSANFRVGTWIILFTPMFPISVIALILYVSWLALK